MLELIEYGFYGFIALGIFCAGMVTGMLVCMKIDKDEEQKHETN